MKLILATAILCFVTVAWARDGVGQIEPPTPGVLYYLDSSGKPVSLEAQAVNLKRQFHAKGFAGFTSIYRVEGEKSPVRFSAGKTPEFVVRLAGRVDPLESVQFDRFEDVDGSRILPVEKVDAFGILMKILPNPAIVDFNAVQFGSTSFKLVPVHPLEPGEYCLIVALVDKPAHKSPGFCLGIDPASR